MGTKFYAASTLSQLARNEKLRFRSGYFIYRLNHTLENKQSTTVKIQSYSQTYLKSKVNKINLKLDLTTFGILEKL